MFDILRLQKKIAYTRSGHISNFSVSAMESISRFLSLTEKFEAFIANLKGTYSSGQTCL